MTEINKIPASFQLPHFYWWKNCAKHISIIAEHIENEISTTFSDDNEYRDDDIATINQIVDGLRKLSVVAQKRADELENPIRQFDKLCLQGFRNKKRSNKKSDKEDN